MKKVLISVTGAAILAAFSVLVVWGQQSINVTETANCVISKASDDEVRSWGREAAMTGKVLPGALSAKDCPGQVPYMMQETLRKDVAKELLLGPAYTREAFRAGIYEATLGMGAPEEAYSAAAAIGLWLENAYVARRDAIACNLVQPEAVAFVEQLDYTFVLASLGVKGNVGNVEQAKLSAEKLLSRAQVLHEQVPSASCTTLDKKDFLSQAEEYALFYKGEHPWSKGCRAILEDQDVLLKCDGAGSKQ